MSAALVRQALEIVDPDFNKKGKGKKKVKSKSAAFSLFPEKYKIIGKVQKKGARTENIGIPIEKKYTVEDAKRSQKSRKQILNENLRKLEIIKNHSKVVLDDNLTKTIIERAVTRRPIETIEKKTKNSETAFTEEDFKKFEEEYLNSED